MILKKENFCDAANATIQLRGTSIERTSTNSTGMFLPIRTGMFIKSAVFSRPQDV
ncbi:MAG: hypothetical protein ACYSU8_08675 [Planctomycetota bacterium]